MPMRLHRKRFFVASSDALSSERNRIELLIQRRNVDLVGQGVFFEVVRWEELLQSFHRDGVQKRYSEELATCDVLIALFHRKIGPFTKAELDLAYTRMMKDLKPRQILVYFKRTGTSQTHSDVVALRRQIKADGQLARDFHDEEELANLVNTQLSALTRDYLNEVHELQALSEEDPSTEEYVGYMVDLLQTNENELEYFGKALGIDVKTLQLPPRSLASQAKELRYLCFRQQNELDLFRLLSQRHPSTEARRHMQQRLGAGNKRNLLCAAAALVKRTPPIAGIAAEQANVELITEPAGARVSVGRYLAYLRDTIRDSQAVLAVIGNSSEQRIGIASHVETAILYAIALKVRSLVILSPSEPKELAQRLAVFRTLVDPRSFIEYRNPVEFLDKLQEQLHRMTGRTP
jgi:hypothetical protein